MHDDYQATEDAPRGQLGPLANTRPAPQVWAVIRGATKLVNCTARVGDWAVTTWDGFATITHLPTGATCYQSAISSCHLERMLDALGELAKIPKFDLQTARSHSGAIHAALSTVGLT